MPVLRLIWPLALIALLATALGRMAAPAVAGVAVGIDRVVRALDLAGAILSQLFAIGAVIAAVTLIHAVATSRSAYALRIGAVVAGGFVVMVLLSAMIRRVPGLSSALIGVGAAALAIGAAWDARRAPFARPVALALGLVGLGALVRIVAVVLSDRAAAGGPPSLAGIARGVATAAFAADGLAVLVATASLMVRRSQAPTGPDVAAQAPPGEGPRLTSPLTLIALVLAFLAARQAVAGGAEDARVADLLIRRALDRLLTRPLPLVPASVQLFVAALSLIVAVLALIAPRRIPPLSGALALVLVARSSPDVPLGAIALVVAAFGVALAARDDRALWAALLAGRAGSAAAQDGAGGASVRHVDAADDNR